MNLDGRISVTDGVLALRVAAGIQTQVACSSSQADAIFGQIMKTLNFGSTASPGGARARRAARRPPAPTAASPRTTASRSRSSTARKTTSSPTGRSTIADTGPDTLSLFYDTSDFVISTGEIIDTFGALDFAFSDVDRRSTACSRTRARFSATTPTQFSEVLLDSDFVALSGQVTTTITRRHATSSPT